MVPVLVLVRLLPVLVKGLRVFVNLIVRVRRGEVVLSRLIILLVFGVLRRVADFVIFLLPVSCEVNSLTGRNLVDMKEFLESVVGLHLP